jgi:hypothetical protein
MLIHCYTRGLLAGYLPLLVQLPVLTSYPGQHGLFFYSQQVLISQVRRQTTNSVYFRTNGRRVLGVDTDFAPAHAVGPCHSIGIVDYIRLSA